MQRGHRDRRLSSGASLALEADTEIDAPDAAGIAAVRINDRSDIVGMFNDAAGRFRGFVWNRGSDSTASMPGLRRIDARAGLE